jgi:hypothetical protein
LPDEQLGRELRALGLAGDALVRFGKLARRARQPPDTWCSSREARMGRRWTSSPETTKVPRED